MFVVTPCVFQSFRGMMLGSNTDYRVFFSFVRQQQKLPPLEQKTDYDKGEKSVQHKIGKLSSTDKHKHTVHTHTTDAYKERANDINNDFPTLLLFPFCFYLILPKSILFSGLDIINNKTKCMEQRQAC